MARIWNKKKLKKQDEEADEELIAPYAAPAPKIGKLKLSLILLVLIVLRLIMLLLFCLPWSILNLTVIYNPRSGVSRQLYWGTPLRLENLFIPVQFNGGYNTDRFREIISYIYIVDCGFQLLAVIIGFFTVHLKTLMVLCIFWLIWGLMSLGVFLWGYYRFAIRKQFIIVWYYLDFAYIFLLLLFLLIMICSVKSLTKHGYISLPAISMRGIRNANIVVPKANPDDPKSVTMKDDKDLVEMLGGDSETETPSLTTPTPTTTTTTSVDPSGAQTPNPNQPGNFGPYGPYPYGPYGQFPPPPYGQGPYGPNYGPGGPYGPNFQQHQLSYPSNVPQQQQPYPPNFQQQPPPSSEPSTLTVPQAEPTPQRTREVSIAASTLTTATSAAPTPQQPTIVSVGPNPYELQAMLERLIPKERERERQPERERPTGSNFTEITISRKKKKKDKKKKKKKSKHKKRKKE